MISLNTNVKRANIFITKKVGEETVIFDIQKGKFYQLNSTSEIIWKYLWRERTVEELVNKIVKEFKINPSTAKNDTINFIEKYRNNLFFVNG